MSKGKRSEAKQAGSAVPEEEAIRGKARRLKGWKSSEIPTTRPRSFARMRRISASLGHYKRNGPQYGTFWRPSEAHSNTAGT